MSPETPTDDRLGGDACPHCGHEVGDSWLICAWCGEQLAVAAELSNGARLGGGRYQILQVIGRGGFGITYDVGDRRLQRRVAMKELFPESAVRHGSMVLTPPQGRAGFKVARERFLREARVLARFTHPGIVRVYEVFEEHGTAYLVMELLEGRTLIELLQARGKPFPERDVLDVAGRVAAALRPVHAAGVLHRDVNPSNVMMTHHGRIVVIDFGLARDYDQDETVGMTRVVTPGYAPLEQYRGEGRFGPSTDVYGLAATCYRLATGRVPISAVERDAGAPLPSPHSLNPTISKRVGDAILDGLELEPNHRPQDLDSFLARLGLVGLPEGPRSIVLDLVPPSTPAPASAAPRPARPTPAPPRPVRPARPARPVPPRPSPDEPSGETVVVPRPSPTPPIRDRPDATAVAGAAPAVDQTRAADPPRSFDQTRAADPPRPFDQTRAADSPRPFDQTRAADLHRAPVGTGTPVHGFDDGLPRPVGPDQPGRRSALVPLWLVVLALAVAAPVVALFVVVLVLLPALATAGDSSAHRHRLEQGTPGGWAEQRMSSGALAPARFLRNVTYSVVRALPLIGVGAVLLLGWYGLAGLHAPDGLLHVVLRGIGALVVGTTVLSARHGSTRFRSGRGIDAVVAWIRPDGRFTERVVVVWLVSGLLVAGALFLTPSPFPLP